MTLTDDREYRFGAGLRRRAILIMVVSYILGYLVFAAAGGVTGFYAPVLAGIYTLTAISAAILARGILGLFVDLRRPIALFSVLTSLTDPFLALAAPITPGFLLTGLRPFYAAFLIYALKVFMFGAAGLPPVWLILFFAFRAS